MTDFSEQTKQSAREIVNYWVSNVSLEKIIFVTHNGIYKKFVTQKGLYLELCRAIENDKEFDIVEER